MKRFTKHLALLVTFLLTSVSASAFDVDGIRYNITDATNHKVEVTYLYRCSESNSVAYTGDVVIPSTVTNGDITYDVTSIGEFAFYYCSGLTSVTIPNSVTSIGNSAFTNCIYEA